MQRGKSVYGVNDALRDLQAIVDKQEAGAHDLESHHVDADDILLRLIDHQLVSELYERIEKWYA